MNFTDFNNSKKIGNYDKNDILQSFTDELKTSLYEKYSQKIISHDLKEKLNEMNDCENKTTKLIVEMVIKFEKENNFLKNQNEKIQVDLKAFKVSLKNAQKNYESLKKNYRMLQIKNKNIRAKLNSIKNIRKFIEVDHSEEKAKKKFTKEDSDQTYKKNSIEGLFTVNSFVLFCVLFRFYYYL